MRLIVTCLLFLVFSRPAFAFLTITEVESPQSRLSAWLVEDSRLPIVTIKLTWRGGTASDPDGKSGLTSLLSSLMNEGAGERNGARFQEAMANIGLQFGFEADIDSLSATIRFMTSYRADAEALLTDAFSEPRFDDEAIARMKSELNAIIAYNKQNPGKVAREAWFASAFPKHPYGRPSDGKPEETARLTRQDLIAHHASLLARDNLYIAAVGDISRQQLEQFLDRVLGALPARNSASLPPAQQPITGRLAVQPWQGPQSAVVFGLPGVATSDPDFFAAYVMNYILGGGGFASRLMEELREKRGLTYGVYSNLHEIAGAPLWLGQFASQKDKVREGLNLLQAEMRKMRETRPTEEELEATKNYLIGAYALLFDSGSSIAQQMINVQWRGWSRDYFENRSAKIRAVSAADVQRIAQRLLSPDDLLVQIVGQPEDHSPD
jgi:zinc protease